MARYLLCILILPSIVLAQHVTIADSGTYYHVVCDLASAGSRHQMGLELGQQVAAAAPEFGTLVDSYLAERSGSNSTYNAWIARMGDIWPQVPQEFRDEIDGMTEGVAAETLNVRGDGKLSRDEIRVLNLFPDCARSSQCAGLTVFGAGSASGSPMTARVLDWHSGNQNQLGQVQAVTFIQNGSQSVCLVGHLGFMGAVTGFNEDGLFAGILDSPTGAAYSSAGKRSYAMDIRHALENFGDMDSAAAWLADTSRHYAYNHLVLMSDRNGGGVLENNFSGSGTAMRRALRRDSSGLNPGVEWEHPGAVAAVNSFVLAGNHDNHSGVQFNTGRWSSIRNQLGAFGQVEWEELKLIAGFDNGNGPGYEYTDIYNAGNHQIVCYRPDSMVLEVAFKPKSGILPDDPIFQRVPVAFDSSAGTGGQPSLEPTGRGRLRVYPNPCRGRATVSLEAWAPNPASVRLYDINGRRIMTMVDAGAAKEKTGIDLDLAKLPRGVYLVTVVNGNIRQSAKLVKVE
jgi:hypothetical protein